MSRTRIHDTAMMSFCEATWLGHSGPGGRRPAASSDETPWSAYGGERASCEAGSALVQLRLQLSIEASPGVKM